MNQLRRIVCVGVLGAAVVVPLSTECGGEESSLQVGFASREITPELNDERPVWLAGYGFGRKATGVHDPLYARGVVLQHGDRRIAAVSVDLVGLQYPVIKRIRSRLPDYHYVLVSSTHNHEAPDVVGLWGPTMLQCGVDNRYLKRVEDRIVAVVEQAGSHTTEVTAAYGTAEDKTLLGDSRQPISKDPHLRVLKFTRTRDRKLAGILVQWNCHPEALGAHNTLVTADFPAWTIEWLRDRYGCPVAYFSGALGGLMAPPDGRILDDAGAELKEGDFEYARQYGFEVARLTTKALEGARPIVLTPMTVSAHRLAVPVHNPLYSAAQLAGVLRRQSYRWTGDAERLGKPLRVPVVGGVSAVETEVACLRLGELHVACIPGEIYPELVYGRFQEPADPGADYPDAPLEPTVTQILPGEKWLLFGMANDEIGYIIPRRQWDNDPPFAYGRSSAQYGEINSCTAHAAPIVMQSLARCVKALGRASQE